MKSYNYSRIKKKHRAGFNRTHPIHKEPSLLNGILGQILLVLVGGLIGIMGNQWFFEKNKRFESDLQIQQQVALSSIPYYTRIINFTATYEITYMSHYTTTYNTQESYLLDQLMGIDTLSVTVDTVKYTVPSFVVDSVDRGEFLADLEFIKSNKDKISNEVWGEFQEVVIFLDNNPLPPLNSKDAPPPKWSTKKVQDEWNKLLSQLHKAAVARMNKPI